MTVKLRYKDPDKNSSNLLEKIVKTNDIVSNPSEDYMFCCCNRVRNDFKRF